MLVFHVSKKTIIADECSKNFGQIAVESVETALVFEESRPM